MRGRGDELETTAPYLQRPPRQRCSCDCRRPPAKEAKRSAPSRESTTNTHILIARLLIISPIVLECFPRCEARDILCGQEMRGQLGAKAVTCSLGELGGLEMPTLTLDLDIVRFSIPHQQGRRLAVEWVCRVRVAEQLRKEHFEDVDHVEHGGPGLVDDVQAD